jgi:hypothetical protein
MGQEARKWIDFLDQGEEDYFVWDVSLSQAACKNVVFLLSLGGGT